MTGIALFAPDEDDYTTNGICLLYPSKCEVHEIAGGMYETTMTVPITDDNLKWAMVRNGCQLRVPCPVRESPAYEYDVTVPTRKSRDMYRLTKKSALMNKAGGRKKVVTCATGTMLIKMSENAAHTWSRVMTKKGKVGWIKNDVIVFKETISDYITPSMPQDQSVMSIVPARDQIFRVYSVELDSAAMELHVAATHIMYDLKWTLIAGQYNATQKPGSEIMQHVESLMNGGDDFSLYYDLIESTATGDYAYTNPVAAMLDDTIGVVPQTNSMLVRDNFDVWMLPMMTRDRGVTVRRKKNLNGVTVVTDDTDVVTRILPAGQSKSGALWFAPRTPNYVDSPNHFSDYPQVRMQKIDYDVKLVDKDPDGVTTFKDSAAGRTAAGNRLFELARKDFEAGVDLPTYSMEVDFEILANTEEYAAYADLQSIHLYDQVHVIDSVIGVNAIMRVTEYTWDVLTGKYASMTLGDILSVEPSTFSYQISGGSISGTKIANGTLNGEKLTDLSLDYAKIKVAAIDTLCAQSISAAAAYLQSLSAESIETDELAAGFANIMQLVADKIDAGEISTNELAAAMASIVVLSCKRGYFDEATVTHLVSNVFNLDGTGTMDDVFIHNLTVGYAQMVGATLGSLILKGSDDEYYSITVDSDGTLTAENVTDDLTPAEITAGQTTDGKRAIVETVLTAADMSAINIKGTVAAINKVYAAMIDVDRLFAREGFLTNLWTKIIYGDRSISMIVADTEDAIAQNVEDIGTAQDSADAASTAAALAQRAAAAADDHAGTAQTLAERIDNTLAMNFDFTADDGLVIRKTKADGEPGRYYTQTTDTGYAIIDSGSRGFDLQGTVFQATEDGVEAGSYAGGGLIARMGNCRWTWKVK